MSYSLARVKLTYPENLIREPIIARMVREFGVMPNIRRANVEETVGWIVCELGGDPDSVERAIASRRTRTSSVVAWGGKSRLVGSPLRCRIRKVRVTIPRATAIA